MSAAVVPVRLALCRQGLADHGGIADTTAGPSAEKVVSALWTPADALWVLDDLLHTLPEVVRDDRWRRPFDLDRDGFVLSDGAGVVVIEEYEHAKRRGARIYAELIGIGMNSDAYHMTAPSKNGEGARDCMLMALQDAGVNLERVDYINAHGTSTPAGDIAETAAIKGAFRDRAYTLAVSSTKSMTGHMLGAAGGAEAVFTILAIRDQVAPPTINSDTPDPECDLDYVPNCARQMSIDVAISNSFGFGGTNGTLAFRRFG